MTITGSARYALGVFAAAATLTGCASGASQAGFTPSGAMPRSLTQPDSKTGLQKGLTQYYLVKLGGKNSYANSINDRGWISGYAGLPAALWIAARKTDLGTLGGPNSDVPFPVKNTQGELVGFSDTAQADPYSEDFCADSSGDLCLGFRWKHGTMAPLPTLGGNNGQANGENDRGQVVGWAEKATQDPSCRSPQVFDIYGVIWQPNGTMITLPPETGDTNTGATAINNSGWVVGASGFCASPNGANAVHAVLWQSGSTIDLGNFGGTMFNIATAVNNRGQIAGLSSLPGNATTHAFLWQNGTISDLGTLPGDVSSAANGINDKGQIVGQSCDANGNCRGFIWQSGSMTDLNLLVKPSKYFIVAGSDINDNGGIAGAVVDQRNAGVHSIVLLPGSKTLVVHDGPNNVMLPEGVRMQLRHYRGFRPGFSRR